MVIATAAGIPWDGPRAVIRDFFEFLSGAKFSLSKIVETNSNVISPHSNYVGRKKSTLYGTQKFTPEHTLWGVRNDVIHIKILFYQRNLRGKKIR